MIYSVVMSITESEIKNCTKCPLSKSRTKLVFGIGNPNADIVIVGEAPGKNEDLQGEPFVGRGGKLLDNILKAINLNRKKVYILNVLKCRPPENRDPKPQEISECEPYLKKQLKLDASEQKLKNLDIDSRQPDFEM